MDAVVAMWGDIEAGKYMPDPNYKSGTEIAEILEDDPNGPVYYFDGNGYVVEMVHAIIDFARKLGIKSIAAPVAKENKASIRQGCRT